MTQTINVLNKLWVKFTLVLLASVFALLMSNAGQALAHSGTYNTSIYEGTTYTVRIDGWPWGWWCDIQYQVGEAYYTAYSKFRISGSNTNCAVGTQVHTPGSQPAGNNCYSSNYGYTSCAYSLGGGWYQSQSSAYTTHAYSDFTISVGSGDYEMFYDFRVTSWSYPANRATVSTIWYCGSTYDGTHEGCFYV